MFLISFEFVPAFPSSSLQVVFIVLLDVRLLLVLVGEVLENILSDKAVVLLKELLEPVRLDSRSNSFKQPMLVLIWISSF